MCTWQGNVKWIIPFVARATKTANKTAQWANLVVQSETENTQRPQAGYQTQDFLDLYPLWVSLSSLSPFNPPTPSHQEPLAPGLCGCVYVRVCILVTTEVLYSPVQSHALQFRCALSILPLIPLNGNASAELVFRACLSVFSFSLPLSIYLFLCL